MQDMLNMKTNEFRNLQGKNEELKNKVKHGHELEEKLYESESQCAQMAMEITRLRNVLDNKEREIEKINNNQGNMKEEVAKYKKKKDDVENQFNQQVAQWRQKEKELNDEKRNLVIKSQKADELNELFNRADSEVGKLRNLNDEKDREI